MNFKYIALSKFFYNSWYVFIIVVVDLVLLVFATWINILTSSPPCEHHFPSDILSKLL